MTTPEDCNTLQNQLLYGIPVLTLFLKPAGQFWPAITGQDAATQ
jgi:hypothetical protein